MGTPPPLSLLPLTSWRARSWLEFEARQPPRDGYMLCGNRDHLQEALRLYGLSVSLFCFPSANVHSQGIISYAKIDHVADSAQQRV